MTDATMRSWIESADGHPDFPLANLPLGVASFGDGDPRCVVAIGEEVLDLRECVAALGLDATLAARTLNAFIAKGAPARIALRERLLEVLGTEATEAVRTTVRPALHPAAACVMQLPCAIGDYTDFFAGIFHATNMGRQFRPDTPLLPNYKYVPIAYHGRASSIRPSGGLVRRPNGQRKPATETVPTVGPSRNLDYELELGVWVGPGNALGEPVKIGDAAAHIAGFCLLNDWSARDVQGWEYQPLGPFLAKNFHTTISPWIVTPEALAPFRVAQPPRPEGDPAPLAYLWDTADQASGGLDIALEVQLLTAEMRAKNLAPYTLSRGSTRHLYWTVAQMLAHHTSGGCDLRPGDLLGSGTISGPDAASYGSLLEITNGGRRPIELPSGETRRFLDDGDEVIFTARAARDGVPSIGFGACRATIAPAPQ